MTIEQDAERNLKRRKRNEIRARQQTELGRVEIELARQLGREHRVRIAQQIGKVVAERKWEEQAQRIR